MIFELVLQRSDSQDPDHTLWFHPDKLQFTSAEWGKLLQDIWDKRDKNKGDQELEEYLEDTLRKQGWVWLRPTGRTYIDSWRDYVS